MRIRAAVLRQMGLPRPYAESRPLSLEDVELDPPGRSEVLVRIRAAGLCHSDLSVIDGNRPRPLPMVLEHEAAGVVEAIGPEVSDLRPGDHVVTAFVPACGACPSCRRGRPVLCEPALAANSSGTLLCGARRLHRAREDLHHHLGVSAFAEYAVVARESLVQVDPTLAFEVAAMFGCAVMTGTGAILNTARMPEGSSAAVVGLGGVGLAALLAARVLHAEPLIALDVHEHKLATARALGATVAFDANRADCIEQVRDATQGGVEFAFEMAGSTRALETAYRITRRGGTTVTAGLSHPAHDFCVRHVSLVTEERTIKGSYLGSCAPGRDIPRYVELYQSGRLPVDRLLSERFGLDEINTGFDRLAAGESLRQMVIFD